MITARNLPAIIVLSVTIIILAIIAVALSHSRAGGDVYDLKIQYGIVSDDQTIADEAESIFDFLNFNLDPVVVEPRGKAVRSREPSNKQIAFDVDELEIDLPMVKSPAALVVAEEDAQFFEELTAMVAQEKAITYQAVLKGDLDDCSVIETLRQATDCRDEIYFQKAIAEGDAEFCEKIEGENLHIRCKTYLNLEINNEA